MKYKTLSSLPGGSQHYLQTLLTVIRWVQFEANPTYHKLNLYFVEQHDANESSAGVYVRMLKNLGIVEQHEDAITLSPLAKQLLGATNEQQQHLLLNALVTRFFGVTDILWIFHQLQAPLHIDDLHDHMRFRYPNWQSKTPVYHRVLWLNAAGCLVQETGQTYRITDMGSDLVQQFPLDSEEPFMGQPVPNYPEDIDAMIAGLIDAAQDSQAPSRLEQALVNVFQFLGFQTVQAGGPGQPDLVLTAQVGTSTYRVIVDAKTRQHGRLYQLSPYTLLEHAKQHNADYSVVVANKYGEGKVTRQATEHGIALITVSMLVSWIRLHATTPLDLITYQHVFQQGGVVSFIPPKVIAESKQKQELSRLIADILLLMEETYHLGLNETIPTEQIMGMLVTKLRGVYYTRHQVNQVVDFMKHPLIGVAIEQNGGNILCVDRWTIVNKLRSLAQQIEQQLIPLAPNHHLPVENE